MIAQKMGQSLTFVNYLGLAGALSMSGEMPSIQLICLLTGQRWVASSNQGGAGTLRWWLVGSCIDWLTLVSVGEEMWSTCMYGKVLIGFRQDLMFFLSSGVPL